MDFSEDWKSYLPISSVHSPPLLLSGPSSKPILGPLLFNPSPQTLTTLFSSPSLRFQIPPPSTFSLYKSLSTLTRPTKDPFIPPSVISSIGATEFNKASSQSDDDETDPISNNNLQFLRCPNTDILIFFPTGENSERVGFVKLALKNPKPEITVDKGGNIFTAETGFNFRILKIMVTSVAAAGSGFPLVSGHSITAGFLLACTLYSVHWFRVDIGILGSDFEKPVLVHLGTKDFKSSVLHACWSPHLLEESVVLLENGELFLFDLSSCSKDDKLPMKLKGTRIKVSWENCDLGLDFDPVKVRWLSCEFGWHPRIFVVACSSAVFEVDWRFEESNASTLAKIELFVLSHYSAGPDEFVAFCKAGSDGFCFSVASKYQLYLLDTRKPLTPVLQWAHGLDKPRYINVFRLSELRSTANEDKYEWANESGFAILLGSLWNCEFSLFCYGPPFPAPYGSVAFKISELCNSLYAWELPSDLSLSGRQCRNGDCHLREDFSKSMLSQWVDWRQKKEIVLGFCIVGVDLSDPQHESDGLGGFRLIRLVSSGKFESQIYHASWDCGNPISKEPVEQTQSKVENSLLYSFSDQKYKFPRRFKYLRLDYLLSYLNGNLLKVLNSVMHNPHEGSSCTRSCTQDLGDLLCDKLKAAGVDQIGSLPLIANVFNSISLPMSIYEIASSRIWAGLPVDVLQLAFSTYSELLEVLVDQKKVSLEFLDVPDSPQLPPFFLRKPSSRSNKWTHKVQPGDALVGPVLPLPVLLNLHGVDKKTSCSVSEEEGNGFSADTELTHQCDKIMRMANGVALPGSFSELHDSPVVSLADDRDENWIGSQDQEPMSLFVYKPSAFSNGNSLNVDPLREKLVPEDDRFATLISKMHEKKFAPNPRTELVGPEMFDELCPIELKFAPVESIGKKENFGPEELKGFKVLKRQFSKWQEGFKKYHNFCTASKIQKRAL
ncbi:hypothetical protein BVC80_8935g30 [Macleaya cordata]|uniref:Uncharacterized protein n=1 Tax=Macleaya cordata TaxID=56857 RepID=A0A200R874_MACCD|nr:hypothetical protein BVC80_8935g30 [Macleaya cordata]